MGVGKSRIRIALALVALAAVGAITATIAQGDDPPSTASFKTVDGANVFMRTAGSGTSTSASIVTGGTVTFSNASVEMHDVHFATPPQGGLACAQTTGGSSASSTTFPSMPKSGSWSGTCTFSKAGTYSFQCDVHDGMTGTVVVSDPAAPPGATTAPVVTATTPVPTTPAGGTPTTPTTTTPTATAPTTSTPAAASGPTPSATVTPVAVTRKLAFKINLAQRGSSVRGTISGVRSLARVKVALAAHRGDVGLKGKASAPVGVGSASALATKNGVLAFVVKLDGKARAALAKRHRLGLTVSITAPSVSGTATQRVFKIVVRP